MRFSFVTNRRPPLTCARRRLPALAVGSWLCVGGWGFTQAHGEAASPAPVVQQSPGPQQRSLVPRFRVTVREVWVSVIVQTKDGEPVADLGREDFSLWDEGRPQAITSFRVDTDATPSPSPAAPQPDAYSNRPRTGVPTRVTAILFDELNTSPEDHANARHHLLQYLGQLDPDGRVALYVIGSRLHVVRDFTSEPRALADAFRRRPADFRVMDVDWEAVFPEPEGMGAGGAANAGAKLHAATRRVGATLQAFRHIVRHLRAVPGRKNLIWISGGFPLSIGYDDFSARGGPRASFEDAAKETARELEDANVAIYPVQAAGLRGLRAFSALQSDPGMAAAVVERKLEQAKSAMRLLAERTGGRAYHDTNGIASAIADAAQDGRCSYTLSFRPDHDKWDGRLRSIKVRVDRPGVRVRTRRGYRALPEPVPTERDSEEVLRSMAASPLPSAGVGLTVRLTEPPDVSGVIRFVMAVDPRDLSLETLGPQRVGALDVVWILQPDGRAQARVVRDTIALDLTPETYARALVDGLTVTKDVASADAAGGLRVVVRDVRSGALGSLSVPTRAMPSAPAPPP